MLKHLAFLGFIALGSYSSSALAINCQRAATLLENTICSNENLNWLDSTMTEIYHSRLVNEEGSQASQEYRQWQQSLEKCTSDACIERAYYKGISQMANPNPAFNWQGLWWNMLAPNRSGSTLQFSRNAEWSVTVDMRAWAGLNSDEFSAEARKIYHMLLIEKIQDNGNCKLLVIPGQGEVLQVYSNAAMGCRLSMPTGAFFDGRYQKSEQDPRVKATLLSLDILADDATDKQFREMVGDDYQNFVDTANVYVYQEDMDKLGARVLSMWLQGAANRHMAIIMYTPSGDMWAARIAPDKSGAIQLHYYSTKGNDQKQMPRTLVNWKHHYLDQ